MRKPSVENRILLVVAVVAAVSLTLAMTFGSGVFSKKITEVPERFSDTTTVAGNENESLTDDYTTPPKMR